MGREAGPGAIALIAISRQCHCTNVTLRSFLNPNAPSRALKKNDVSELTEPESFQDAQSGSASATDMPSTSRRKWDYESLAVVPELAAAFRAFAFRALCQESVLFLEEVSK